MTHPTRSKSRAVTALLMLLLPGLSAMGQATNSIGVADATLDASFYSDASCLLTIDAFVQSGKTVIDADVDTEGSRMLIHCDTEDGRRLTILARGDSLNVAQRAPLLSREEIAEGEFGMIAWLTRSGVHYTDDKAPRRYVIGGSVKLRKSPPANLPGSALNSNRQSFASINGVLESIIKSDDQNLTIKSAAKPENSANKTKEESNTRENTSGTDANKSTGTETQSSASD
ncbi:MAG: hypothetical protein AB8B87_07020 [Granulosicoccus sp.]